MLIYAVQEQHGGEESPLEVVEWQVVIINVSKSCRWHDESPRLSNPFVDCRVAPEGSGVEYLGEMERFARDRTHVKSRHRRTCVKDLPL